MATLQEAGTLTSRLHDLSGALHEELTEKNADFSRMTELAEEIRAQAETLGQTFARIDEVLSGEVENLRREAGGG